MLRLQTADNCLMCGRCAEKCPVGIDLNTLRVNSRDKMHNVPDERRYGYFKGLDRSEGAGKVGYFAGCMTLLTPRTMSAMSAISRPRARRSGGPTAKAASAAAGRSNWPARPIRRAR